MDTFGIRDLRERTGDLTKVAESGHLAVITKRDKPFMVGIPFTEDLLKQGVDLNLAMHLYSEGVISIAKAAKLARCPLEVFIQKLGHCGVDAVTYDGDELDEELQHLD